MCQKATLTHHTEKIVDVRSFVNEESHWMSVNRHLNTVDIKLGSVAETS